MTNEFKKSVKNTDVVYTLESATSGGTSAGSVASVSKPLSGVKKRGGNLLIQSAEKPRKNPVAKHVNATVGGGGAGAHKDRKKAMKRGEMKHKKPFVENTSGNISNAINALVRIRTSVKQMQLANAKIPPAFAGQLEVALFDAINVLRDNQDPGIRNTLVNLVNLRAIAKRVQTGGEQFPLGYLGRLEVVLYDTIKQMEDINQDMHEEWSEKYKRSINCSHPKGFSQKAHCAGKKKHSESATMEMVCPDCGMCETHGNLDEIKKGQKDSNGFTKCWPGKHAAGTKKGKHGWVRNCVPNEGLSESHPGNFGFGASATNTVLKTQNRQHSAESYDDAHTGEENGMMTSALKSLYKHAAKLRHAVKQMGSSQSLEPWQQAKITKAADYLDTVFNAVDDDMDLGEDGETHNGGGNTAVANGGNSRPATARKLDKGRGWNDAMNKMGEATTDLDHRISNLELGLNQARNITKAIKYDHTVIEILSEFRALVEKYQLDTKKLNYLVRDVYEAQSALNSAVYSLEEIFKDAITDLELKADQGLGEVIAESKKLNEKSTSKKQARFMAAAAHDPKFAKRVGIKQSVAKEFNKADKGTKQLSKAMKGKKKSKKVKETSTLYLDRIDNHHGSQYKDPYMEALKNKLAEKVLQPNDPVEKYIDVFQKANYNQPGNYQFGKYNPQNRTPQKRERMAKAASYAAKTSKKK